MRKVVLGAVLAAAVAGPWATADVVTDWNEVLLQAIRDSSTPPPKATRAMAIVHVSIYDAVNGLDPKYEPYYVTDAGPAGASAEAAAASAAHTALVALYPDLSDDFDAALDTSLAAIADGTAKDDGVAWGMDVADKILALRENDHSTDVVPYTAGTTPDEWQPTPPAFAAALLPQWPYVDCWTLSIGSQLRQSGPPLVTTRRFTDAFNETKALGAKTGSTRTAEQSEIALFWADGAGTETPPGHWNTIARGVSAEKSLTLQQNARLFALLNIAEADAAICSWDNKYAYDNVRPVTAIRNAADDGNDATEADETWESFIVTPPFPSYTSGHSTFSSTGATVLANFFGTDAIAFTTSSDALPGVERSFDGFWAAAEEAGISRIYGGIHWNYDNEDGLATGAELGDYVAKNFLRALPVTPDTGGSDCTGLICPGNCAPLGGATLSLMLMSLAGLKAGYRRK